MCRGRPIVTAGQVLSSHMRRYRYQSSEIRAYKRLMNTTEIVTYCPEADCQCHGSPLVRIQIFSGGTDHERARHITEAVLRLVGTLR